MVRSGRAQDHNLLLEVALQFGATLDLDRLLGLVVQRMVDLLGAERALCALVEEDQITRAVLHQLEWAGPPNPLPVSYSVLTKALRSQGEVVISDASSDSELSENTSV